MSFQQLKRSVAAIGALAMSGSRMTTGLEGSIQHYPNWLGTKRKTKGKRDRSLRIRSNRRKSA
jgi:hypothetical protein